MNIDIFGSWLNNNQGVLAIILFVIAPLCGFLMWLFKKFFRKKPEKRPPPEKKAPIKSIIYAGRDVNVVRDVIEEQYNIIHNAYTTVNGSNKEQPTPDKVKSQEQEGHMILIEPLTSDIWDKVF